jgi:hypothetical protein
MMQSIIPIESFNQSHSLIGFDNDLYNYFSHTKNDKSNVMWMSLRDTGKLDERILNTELNSNQIQIFSPQTTVQYNVANKPNYVDSFSSSGQIYLEPVVEKHQYWNEKYSGLSQTGSIIVGLAVMAATGFYLPEPTTFSAVVGQAALQSGANTLVTSAINRDFNLEKSLKSIGTSVATAGLTYGVVSQFGDYIPSGFGGKATMGTRALNHGVQSIVAEGVSSVVYNQKFNLGNALESGALSFAASEGAYRIGKLYHTDQIGKPLQLGLHAGLGAGIATLNGGDAAAGAIGAVIGELTAEYVGDPTNKTYTTNLSKLAGALAVAPFAKSGDVQIAADAAGNAAEHNFLFVLPAIPPAVALATGFLAGGTAGLAIAGEGDIVAGAENTGKNMEIIGGYAVNKSYQYYPVTTENTLYVLSLPRQAVIGGIDYVGGDGTAHNLYTGYDAWMNANLGLNQHARAGFGLVGGMATAGFGFVAKTAAYQLPDRLARVVPTYLVHNTTKLGHPLAEDIFVTSAKEIKNISKSSEMAVKLTLLKENGTYITDKLSVIEFDKRNIPLASPVFRENLGFIKGGLTKGGVVEFSIPNKRIDELNNVKIRNLK